MFEPSNIIIGVLILILIVTGLMFFGYVQLGWLRKQKFIGETCNDTTDCGDTSLMCDANKKCIATASIVDAASCKSFIDAKPCPNVDATSCKSFVNAKTCPTTGSTVNATSCQPFVDAKTCPICPTGLTVNATSCQPFVDAKTCPTCPTGSTGSIGSIVDATSCQPFVDAKTCPTCTEIKISDIINAYDNLSKIFKPEHPTIYDKDVNLTKCLTDKLANYYGYSTSQELANRFCLRAGYNRAMQSPPLLGEIGCLDNGSRFTCL